MNGPVPNTHRNKIPVRIVIDLLHLRQHRNQRRGREKQRVAVRRGLGDILRGEGASRADAIVDNKALFERLR